MVVIETLNPYEPFISDIHKFDKFMSNSFIPDIHKSTSL